MGRGLTILFTLCVCFCITNISLVLRLQLFGKEAAPAQGLAQPPAQARAQVQDDSKICPSLTDLAVQMAKFSSPTNSPSFQKNKQMLSNADRFHIYNPTGIFEKATQSIIHTLSGYGLNHFKNETIDSDDSSSAKTIVIEWSAFFRSKKQRNKCKGSRCNDMPRIIIQTEQVTPGLLKRDSAEYKECSQSSNCVIWDFSDANFEQFKKQEMSDSVMIVPLMFQHFMNKEIPSELKPIKDRTIDAVMFGLMTRRRQVWSRGLSSNSTTLSLQNVVFRKQNRRKLNIQAYADSKICFVVHSFMAESAGEYHRISEIARFGCILVVETIADELTMDTLQRCGGVHFADLDDMPRAIEQNLVYANASSALDLKERQQKFDKWWSVGIEWDSLLNKVLGPVQRV